MEYFCNPIWRPRVKKLCKDVSLNLMQLSLRKKFDLFFFILPVMYCENGEPYVSNNTANSMALAIYDPPKIFNVFEEGTREFKFAGHTLSISQNWEKNGVAAVVWDAALVLSRYLETSVDLVGKKVIELGAGTGLVGLVAASLGARVFITDRKIALELAKNNVERNHQNFNTSTVEVHELDWGQDVSSFEPPFDYVLGADIVYIEDTFQQLLHTITELCGEKTIVFLSCKIRYQRDKNFLGLLNKKFIVENILYDKTVDIHTYKAVLRTSTREARPDL